MRKRIKLRSGFCFNIKLKDKIIAIVLLIFICSSTILFYLDKLSHSTVLEYAKNETTLLSTLAINEAVEKSIDSFNKIEDLVYETKNKNDEIISVDFNAINVNKILTVLNKNILNNLKYIENGKINSSYIINREYIKNDGDTIFYIPIGIVTNNLFLTSVGYKIPIKMNPIGSVISKIETNIEEYGINNIIFKMYIKVEVKELILLPFISETVTINIEVPLIVKLIEGKIPSVYGGLLTNTSSLNTLNVE